MTFLEYFPEASIGYANPPGSQDTSLNFTSWCFPPIKAELSAVFLKCSQGIPKKPDALELWLIMMWTERLIVGLKLGTKSPICFHCPMK